MNFVFVTQPSFKAASKIGLALPYWLGGLVIKGVQLYYIDKAGNCMSLFYI